MTSNSRLSDGLDGPVPVARVASAGCLTFRVGDKGGQRPAARSGHGYAATRRYGHPIDGSVLVVAQIARTGEV